MEVVRKINIAIDGPAGAGKSTVAKAVAAKLGLVYVDTGAMYRALTWKAIQQGIDLSDANKLTELAHATEIILTKLGSGEVVVTCDKQDVTALIRTPEVSGSVSQVAKHPGVRYRMVELQKMMAANGGVIMDGRDIGTHVLPQARYKFFLTASLAERARRRGLELQKSGFQVDLAQLEREIAARDLQDESRETAPLVVAPGAVVLNTDGLEIAEVVEKICELTSD
ncbi:MAG TPA: (d)CMP kinase [Verrucomicrobiae bacterium]|nr:(d)CMP kinase [Verrucomicrobiae bacterium]